MSAILGLVMAVGRATANVSPFNDLHSVERTCLNSFFITLVSSLFGGILKLFSKMLTATSVNLLDCLILTF